MRYHSPQLRRNFEQSAFPMIERAMIIQNLTISAGVLDRDTHILPLRVYYEDTDFSGIVYHANYLRFLERGRTEFIRALGVDQLALHRDEGIAFAVRSINVDYLRPALMDD